ncbi:hypothetical protein [Herbiconiux sp.]|uniref:hypothetical protein n=1 Tax=Herbiconiux sp. TaxID=1871186 RepID=UPI0025BFCD3F|nr:hypothetical protein [Herbiconiux sp.]
MSRFDVTAEWTGKWWVLQAVDAPGAISQVKRLSHAVEIVEAIAFVTGEPESSIEFDLRLIVPEAAATEIESADEARELSRHYNALAATKARAAVLELRAGGLTLDDIGAVLHISKQRAGQLLKEAAQAAAA